MGSALLVLCLRYSRPQTSTVLMTTGLEGICFNDKRQPFWFHNLNSMVPVKEIVLFNLVVLGHLFFLFLFPV